MFLRVGAGHGEGLKEAWPKLGAGLAARAADAFYDCGVRRLCGRVNSTMRLQKSLFKTRLTAAELAAGPALELTFGNLLWGPTHGVRFPSPVVSASGRLRTDAVYCVRDGAPYVREYVRPADPKTDRQMDHRGRIKTAGLEWKTLSEEERQGWGRYAAAYLVPEKEGRFHGGDAANAFVKAQTRLLVWGDEPRREPPVLPPPPAPLLIAEEPAPAAGQYAFRVEHTLTDFEGFRFELRMTRATVNDRKPREPEFCRAGETAEGSFFPLAESGAVYLLESPRFQIEPERRYGLGVKLFTREGMPGPELRADLIRQETPPPDAAPELLTQESAESAEGAKREALDTQRLRLAEFNPLPELRLMIVYSETSDQGPFKRLSIQALAEVSHGLISRAGEATPNNPPALQ